MSMNIRVLVDGVEVAVPQSTTDETFDIINSANRKKATIEWLKKNNEKYTTWVIDREKVKTLNKEEKEIYDELIDSIIKKSMEGKNITKDLQFINETLGKNIVIFVEKGIYDDLIEKIGNSNDVKVMMV